MRRNDREISLQEAEEILRKGEYGILSTSAKDGQPYGLPLSYCFVENTIYFHCAVAGHKLDNIRGNNKVSFCVVGNTQVDPEKFSTKYESVIVFGKALEVKNDEKETGLTEIIKKYSKQYLKEGILFFKTMKDKVRVFKIEIAKITGKAKR